LAQTWDRCDDHKTARIVPVMRNANKSSIGECPYPARNT
jgi:hypothetical protein